MSLMHNYGQPAINLVRGEGATVWDDQDKPYLDALSGIAVCGLGHAHPKVSAAICEQAQTLLHVSNLYGIPNQQELGAKLCALSGLERAFFANSGAEANEAAIKLSRLYAHKQGIENPVVLVMNGSFHGRTLATLSATGNPKIQQGFAPLVEGFVHLPYNDMAALQQAVQTYPNAVAVMLEPVQGEGGVNIPDADYLNQVRKLCDEQNWLMILDEVQTGIARTGEWFGFQHNGIKPDILTLAKGLGNGVPIGACLAQGVAAELFTPGTHGSTFGGNPLATRAALAVINTIEDEQLIPRIRELNQLLMNGFTARLGNHPHVKNIRSKGLMIGIELERNCTDLVKRAIENGLLINVTAGQVIRLLPPFVLSNEQAEHIVAGVSELVTQFLQD